MRRVQLKKSQQNVVNNALLLGFIASLSTGVSAALPGDAVLQFNDAVLGGYYGGTVVDGSYFAMDTDGNGDFSENERVPIKNNEGVRLGDVQPASGSHSGSPNGTELPSIDKPWNFFGGTGMHQTTSTVVIVNGDDGSLDNTASLDFSGWGVTWNGIANIPLGGDGSASDTGQAVVVCSAECAVGDRFLLDYFAHVPSGDPSNFGGVYYTVHLEGVVGTGGPLPPTKSVSIDLPDGLVYECSSPEGSVINASANIVTTDINDIVSINWRLDDFYIGEGSSISAGTSLGSHTLSVVVNTVASGSFDSIKNVEVKDTTAPELDVLFIDQHTGLQTTEVSGAGRHSVIVRYDVVDTCDLEATASGVAVPVHAVSDGDTLVVTSRNAKEVTVETSAINVSAEASDIVGNRRYRQATLHILD